MTASLAANLPPWERVAPAALTRSHPDVLPPRLGLFAATPPPRGNPRWAQLGLRSPRGLIGFVPSG